MQRGVTPMQRFRRHNVSPYHFSRSTPPPCPRLAHALPLLFAATALKSNRLETSYTPCRCSVLRPRRDRISGDGLFKREFESRVNVGAGSKWRWRPFGGVPWHRGGCDGSQIVLSRTGVRTGDDNLVLHGARRVVEQVEGEVGSIPHVQAAVAPLVHLPHHPLGVRLFVDA